VADNQTRQVGVYVQVVNPNGAIVAGQFANGTILTEGVKVETVVPIAAVRKNGEKTFALVVVNGTIAERAITVGLRDEAKGVVAIASGINPGERVITAPTMQVTPGTQVRLAGESAGATTDSIGRKK
jgi:multidrug efflux pump subunit AcrA (membrane-fusion protein)